jgi:hypothetical protein
MPYVSTTHATLQFSGDDLDPDDLTARLGAPPDLWARKGEVVQSTRPRPRIAAKTGRWSIGVAPRNGGDLDGQVRELFGLLTSDPKVWRALAMKYKPYLFVSVFTEKYNECLEVSADCLSILGDRGVKLGLDIYGSSDPDFYA